MCTPDINDWILPVFFIGVLSIALVFQITFYTVCVLLTLGVFLYFCCNYVDQGEWVSLRSSGRRTDSSIAYDSLYDGDDDDDYAYGGSTDGYERSDELDKSSAASESNLQCSASSDGRQFLLSNSSVHESRSYSSSFAKDGPVQRTSGTSPDSSTRQAFQQNRTNNNDNWNINSYSSSYIHRVPSDSLSSSAGSHLERRTFSENETVIKNVREHNSLRPSEGLYSQSSSKFRHLPNDVSLQENLPLDRQRNEIYSYPTHQPQYGSLGVLPSVHPFGAHQTVSKEHSSPPFNSRPPFLKLAPPDQLRESLTLHQQTGDSSVSSNDVSVAHGKNSSPEKRKRNVEGDELEELSSCSPDTVIKRRKTYTEMLSSRLSTETAMAMSYLPNLKRPALNSVSDDPVSPKVQRLSQPVSRPLSTQPGASARNPVEASYVSSKRWLDRMATPESSTSSKFSSNPVAQKLVSSGDKTYSKAWSTINKMSPESRQTERMDNRERSSVETISKGSVRVAHPSSGKNTPVCTSASPTKGAADENRIDKSGSSEDSLRTNKSPSLGVNSPSELASYKVHVTAEDVEKDREKELERSKRILGEESDLIPESESQQQTSSFSSPLGASFRCSVAASAAGDVSSVAVTLHPTTAAASSSTSVLQSVDLAVLPSTAVAIPSESSSSKLTPATSGGQPEPARSLQLSVVSGSSPNLVQFAASSQSEVPLRSAGFDVRSGSAPSLSGFQFAPVSSEMASVTSGGLTYKSSMPTVASNANAGFNLLQSGLAKGEVSGVHSTSLPGINVNNDSNKFSFELTRKAPDMFISQSSSATTTGVDFGNAGSSAIAQTGFTLPNKFSQNSSVFPNSGISSSNTIPTTSNGSNTVYSISQATPVTNSKRTASVDFLNDINRSQVSKNQDTPKTTSSNSYPGALGFSLGSSALLSSSHVLSTASSVNSTPVNSFMSPQISSDPFGGPTSTVANNFLQAANTFSSPISSPGFFGPTSSTATFGNQSLGSFASFSSPSGVNFGNQTDQHNAFMSQAASGFPVQGNFALPNAMDIKASEQATQPPGSFGSFFNFLPTNTTDPKSFGSQLPSGGLNSSSSSGLAAAFPPNQNLGSANTSNLFSFGQPENPFSFGQSSGSGFSSILPNNSTAVLSNQFPQMQNQFNSASPFTPKFSIGTDSSSSTKSRPLQKSRLRRR